MAQSGSNHLWHPLGGKPIECHCERARHECIYSAIGHRLECRHEHALGHFYAKRHGGLQHRHWQCQSGGFAGATNRDGPGNVTRAYGQTNPPLPVVIVGLQSADNITAAGTCSATTSSTPGSYPITPVLSDPSSRLTNYTVATNNGTLTVEKATPVITWTNRATVVYGTPLSGLQLDPESNVPGSFSFNPPQGTVLKAGLGQTLSVTLTPADSTDYSNASAFRDDQRPAGTVADFRRQQIGGIRRTFAAPP